MVEVRLGEGNGSGKDSTFHSENPNGGTRACSCDLTINLK